MLVAALALVVVAAGLLVWSVIGMVSAGGDVDSARQAVTTANKRLADLRDDDSIEVKTARDQALAAGRKGVATMNTVDYCQVDANLDEWERITTGDLHDSIVNGREQSQAAITNAKSVTKATILAVAAEDVNAGAGTATVLVAVEVAVAVGDAAPTDRYLRITSTLLRTDQGWKLNGLGQVPYQQ